MKANEFSLRDENNQSLNDKQYRSLIGDYFANSQGTTLSKLENFVRFVPRQSLALFLAKNYLFEKIIEVHGSIVECGVFMGGGLFTWAQLSSIHEPVNHNRKIFGFDSFEGFPYIGNEDMSSCKSSQLDSKKSGRYRFDAWNEIVDGVDLYDKNRSIGHIPKIDLIKGDAVETIPNFVKKNPHVVVALLYLDFDLYEPTKAALRAFLPRMPKGAILVFDELNQAQWPGETLAVLEEVGLRNIAIKRFPFTPSISYAVLD